MKEILPTQFEDAPLKVEGSLLGKICRAISSLKPSIGWGLRASQTDAGFHFEVDRDQIKDPQLKLLRVVYIEPNIDQTYPEVVVASPAGNPEDIHFVSIATPLLRDRLLETPANDSEYANAYEEYVETVWRRNDGVVEFVATRMSAPTGNDARDGDGHKIDVYWLAEDARILNLYLNDLSGDPWISVAANSADTGLTTDSGEKIYTLVSEVRHKQMVGDTPALEYDTVDTGSTNQSLSLVTWANPNLTITPVTLAQDDAGHIHTFTAGADTVANLAGASDELVASQAGQVAGYLEDVAVAADPWIEINTNGADVEWGHADADPNGNGAGIGADSEIKAGDDWTLIRNNADPALGAASDAAFDEKGHYYDGDRWVFHADAQAAVVSLEPMGSYTSPSSGVLRLPASTVPVDDKGHVNTGSSATNNRDITFSGDNWLLWTIGAAGGNGTVEIEHNGAQAVSTTLDPHGGWTAPGSGVVRFAESDIPLDANGHVNDTSSSTTNRDITFTSSDSSVSISATAAAGNATVDITGAGGGQGYEDVHYNGVSQEAVTDGGVIDFDDQQTPTAGTQQVDWSIIGDTAGTAQVRGEVDIDAFLKALSGYSGVKKQVLVNDNGTIKWVDTAECP